MNWSNYIPLLIVFIVIFRSVTKETREKNRKITKTRSPHHKNEKATRSIDTFTVPSIANKVQKNKSTKQVPSDLKAFSINDTHIKMERLNNDLFPIMETNEICRAIIYAEIFNKKFYD